MENTRLHQFDTFLAFTLNNELFAIKVEKTLEVLENNKITVIPNTPDYIEGVINFRGDILPIINTKAKFSLSKDNETNIIIVLELNHNNKKQLIGITADTVKGVINILIKDIQKTPEMNSEIKQEFISGVYRFENKFYILLDADKVFSLDEIKTKNLA